MPTTGLQYLTVWPDDQSQPVASTLNNQSTNPLANGAIIQAGAADGVSGGIKVFASDQTQLIIDVNGYFVKGTGRD